MVGWFCVWFFLENKTSCAGLLGPGFKKNFQLKARLEINWRSSWIIFVCTLILILNYSKERVVSSTSHWCRQEKGVDLKLNLWKHLLKLVSEMTFVHLKSPFGACLLDSFQEGYKVLLRCPYSYKVILHAEPCQMLLICLRKVT